MGKVGHDIDRRIIIQLFLLSFCIMDRYLRVHLSHLGMTSVSSSSIPSLIKNFFGFLNYTIYTDSDIRDKQKDTLGITSRP